MRTHRLSFLALFAAIPAAAALSDVTPASADTYSSCIARIQQNHASTCAEVRREDRNAACPPLTAQYLTQMCGTAPVPVSGTIRPKFTVVTVIYAPPGSANKGGGSSVDYGQGTTIGVNESASSSFKTDVSASATVTAGTQLTGTVDFTLSTSSSDSTGSSSSIAINKSVGSDINVSGPSTDGIDHQQDEIWMLLSPIVNLTAVGNSVTWSMSGDGSTVPQYVRVGWLNSPSTMPPAVTQTLAAHGITAADYPTILGRDPFSGKPSPVPSPVPLPPPDPSRYSLVDLLTYEPDSSATAQTYAIKTDTTTTQGTTGTDSYSIGLQVSATAGLADWLKVNLKDGINWTWTNTASTQQSSGTSQSATAKIVSPSLSYQGPTDIAVYWDTVYETFLFFPASGAPVLSGTVESVSGQLAQGADVVVRVGNRTVHAFTDRKGVYRVYGLPAGSASVSANGLTRTVSLGSGAKLDFPRPAGPIPVPPHPITPFRR
jgi:hypothetical protein